MVYPALITVLTLILYMFVTFKVGQGRSKYNIMPPATTGHIEFEKRFRVQQNTMEQMVLFLPALWLFAYMLSKPNLAAIIGAVWLVSRVMSAFSYYSSADKRLPGFIICLLCSAILVAGALWGVIVKQAVM